MVQSLLPQPQGSPVLVLAPWSLPLDSRRQGFDLQFEEVRVELAAADRV